MTSLSEAPTRTVVDTGVERRSAERLDYGLFARVCVGGSDPVQLPTWVVDLSSRGATLLAAHELPGDELLLELQLGEHPVQLPVTVRNRRVVAEFDSRPGPFFRYGVSFAPRLRPADCHQVLADLT